MGTSYNLFADARERRPNVNEALGLTRGGYSEAAPDDVLPKLAAIGWEHPALLVYRSTGESRWSHVTLGLSAKPELGED